MNLWESLILGKSIDSKYVTRKAVIEILTNKNECAFYDSPSSCKLPIVSGSHQPAKERRINQPNVLPFKKYILVPVLRDISSIIELSQLSKTTNLSCINKSVCGGGVKRSERIKNMLEKKNASSIEYTGSIVRPTTAVSKGRKTRLPSKNSPCKENVDPVADNANSKKNLGTFRNFDPNSNILKAKYNLRSLNLSVKQINKYDPEEENKSSKRKILPESGPIAKKKKEIHDPNILTNRENFTEKNSNYKERKSKRKIDNYQFAHQSSHSNEKNSIDISCKMTHPTALTNEGKNDVFSQQSFKSRKSPVNVTIQNSTCKGSKKNLAGKSRDEGEEKENKPVKETVSRKCVKETKGRKGATVNKTSTKNEFVEKPNAKKNLNLREAPLSEIVQGKRGTLKYLKERQKTLKNELKADDMDIFDYSFSEKDKGWYALIDGNDDDDDFLAIKTPKEKGKETYMGMTPRSALINEWNNEKPSTILSSAKKIISPKDEDIANKVIFHQLKSMKPKNRGKKSSTPFSKKFQPKKPSTTADELPLDLALPPQDIESSFDDYFDDSV